MLGVPQPGMDQGKSVLFEGAQGTLLDVDHGTYPFVTASNATAGGACTGTGVGPTRIDGVIGIVKAYTTRVGEGPFPTELHGSIGEEIRKRGKESMAHPPGRPRRCGWFDAVVVRYARLINNLDTLVVTKLDVLDASEGNQDMHRISAIKEPCCLISRLKFVFWKSARRNI